jgi:glycosyltransferase involved in cell wall biosynthesis
VSGSGRAFVGLSPTNERTLTGELDDERKAVWPGEVEFIDWRTGVSRLEAMTRLAKRAGDYDAIVLDGSVGLRGGYLDLFAAAVTGRRGRHGPIVVVADATWKRGVSLVDRLAMRIGIELVDGANVRYCVLTSEEVRRFPQTWGVDPGKVYLVRWPHTLTRAELQATREGGVFAGGDSLRDYGPLVDAAGELDVTITIATRRADVLERTDVPPNVRAGPLSQGEFVEAMRRASVVVVPLQKLDERGAGQTTYCNALALGKLVVATDSVGVRDYIEHRETGLIVPPGDAGALRETLAWATSAANADEIERIAERGREMALDELSPDRYVVNLLTVARTALRNRTSHSPTE